MKHLFTFLSLWTVLAGFSGCVVKEKEHHPHHEKEVYVEPAVVEEKVIVH